MMILSCFKKKKERKKEILKMCFYAKMYEVQLF